jgi:hypothetical protein
VSLGVELLSKIRAPKLCYFCLISVADGSRSCVLSCGIKSSSFHSWCHCNVHELFDKMCVGQFIDFGRRSFVRDFLCIDFCRCCDFRLLIRF